MTKHNPLDRFWRVAVARILASLFFPIAMILLCFSDSKDSFKELWRWNCEQFSICWNANFDYIKETEKQ